MEQQIDIAKLRSGDKVYYQPDYFGEDKWENGMVKEIPDFPNHVRVVYNCAGDWDNYKDYTGELTRVTDLKLGWKH